MASFLFSILTNVALILGFSVLISATEVTHDGRSIIIDGERKLVFSGSIHYPRSTPEMWPDLIRKAKLGGLNAIDTYVFWNAHEPRQRQYNFEGNLDLIRFLKEIKNAGLYAVLRIGPYVCAEWSYGGLPAWLRKIPDMAFRATNKPFMAEMKNFTTFIVDMVKQERLLAPQGGPIIIAQIENEYGNVEESYGEDTEYVHWCAKLAESQNIGVPWIMCQQPDAPQPMINTCNGFYCDDFKPNNPNSPKMWTENFTGWFKKWGLSNPHRRVEDIAFAVARFFQKGGTFQNYYMYHGGTNFGRSAGGPYVATTYDYDAPLDEYGNLRQPKWGHLKELHAALRMMENALLNGDVLHIDLENGITATKYFPIGAQPGCFLSNTNTTSDRTLRFQGNEYFLPPWSVSILPDCKEEVYNTAKVNTETHIMVKKPDVFGEEIDSLSWSWRPEILDGVLKGVGSFSSRKLLDQTFTSLDASDYLWYMTSFHLKKNEATSRTLYVFSFGEVLHAFVNGKLVGSKYSTVGGFWYFTFEVPVTLKPGKNNVSLLSATVGLRNSDPYFDFDLSGIGNGPVKLLGSENDTIDLSHNKWRYKVGLNGMEKELFAVNCKTQNYTWNTDYIPTLRPFTWYKASFEAPPGDEPVVVDLLGMGKGVAWVNGHDLGRFWVNYTADLDSCQPCDYRGPFNPNRCRTGCGEPTQRWYHVPRSFLNAGKPNTLVLFEEAGGDPLRVNLRTVTAGTVCARVEAGKTLTLSCQSSRTISDITFASFGDVKGECGSFEEGECELGEPGEVLSMVRKECIGKLSCSIVATPKKFGDSPGCIGISKKLAVEAICS